MKTIISIIILLSSSWLFSQVKEITISVDGFTCSLCAKGVEYQFKSLEFVKDVKTNLKEATFDIKFKEDKQIKIEEIWDAVDNGGFTVGFVNVNAQGKISKSGNDVKLVTGNSKDISLSGKTGELSDGDSVNIEGKIDNSYKVEVKTIKKI